MRQLQLLRIYHVIFQNVTNISVFVIFDDVLFKFIFSIPLNQQVAFHTLLCHASYFYPKKYIKYEESLFSDIYCLLSMSKYFVTDSTSDFFFNN